MLKRPSLIVAALAALALAACQSAAPTAAPTAPAATAAPAPTEPAATAAPAATTAPTEVATVAPAPTAAPAETTQAAIGATKVITDANGASLEVPADPQRIVVVTQEALDVLLTLGVKPVGITNGQGQTAPPAYLADQVAGIEVVGDMMRPNIESVAKLKPDLILAGDMTEEYHGDALKQLRAIAPTVITTVYGETWQQHLQRIATITGREAQAQQALDAYAKKVADVKAKLGANAGAEVSIVRWNPNGPSFMDKDQFASAVLADLGLVRPANQRVEGHAHSAPLSLEKIGEIDGDWMFIGTLSPAGEDVDAMKSAMDSPLFQQLKAVKNGHVVPMDGAVWSTLGGPVAADKVVDAVAAALAK
ncbi:iron-siderophore ABC transporter substrate-binding protein [Chloroflexia bacterium SDU3-3]|nr:iron-siderophore ABC transporter substrate-binding protein [Chloroflexia bacterium SDU3-3]